MMWNIARKIQKIIPFIILIVLSTKQLQAELEKHCAKAKLVENKELCIETPKFIKEINNDFQIAYSFGNVTSISQPPLIITPEVNIDAPSGPKTIDRIEKPIEVKQPLRAKVKPSQKNQLFEVVKVLDNKGSEHLGRCLKKLTAETRKKHFSSYGEELKTLDTLTYSSKNEINPIKKLFTQTPSRKDCINYLDFILMAG